MQLLTGGGCGIWALIDFISICFNKYQDANGEDLGGYSETLGKVFFFIWLALFVLTILTYSSAIITGLKG